MTQGNAPVQHQLQSETLARIIHRVFIDQPQGASPMVLTLKPLSLSSGFVLSEFASECGPGASAHRFAKTQSEFHLALAYGYGRIDNRGLAPCG